MTQPRARGDDAIRGLCMALSLLATSSCHSPAPLRSTDAAPSNLAWSSGDESDAPAGAAPDAAGCQELDPARPDDCNGVCTSIETHPGNCGACGSACTGSAVCLRGRCAPSCATDAGAPLADCNGSCVDLATHADHCGACDQACAGGQICVAGQCACPTGSFASRPETLCNGTCVDTFANAKNCGVPGSGIPGQSGPPLSSYCGRACPPDFDGGPALCFHGGCAQGASCALAGESVCNGGCVDLSVNNANCGGCNNVCAAGSMCQSGRCTCPGGDAYCHGVCLPVSDDPGNCGGCDVKCGPGMACVGGKCG
jgi:hypothetical protein